MMNCEHLNHTSLLQIERLVKKPGQPMRAFALKDGVRAEAHQQHHHWQVRLD
jgi:hypothetical protein